MVAIFHVLFVKMGDASIRLYMFVHEFIGLKKRGFFCSFFFDSMEYNQTERGWRLNEKSYCCRLGKR